MEDGLDGLGLGLAETLSFLQTLGSCAGSHLGDGELVSGLLQSLLEDGYSLNEYGYENGGMGNVHSIHSVHSINSIHTHSIHSSTADSVHIQRNLSSGGINYFDLVMVGVCVLMAGFASGLTQGLLSLDLMEMEIKSRSGTFSTFSGYTYLPTYLLTSMLTPTS
jgi:hypothetical protein